MEMPACLTALAPHHSIISPVHPDELWVDCSSTAGGLHGEKWLMGGKKKQFLGRHLMLKQKYAEKLLKGEKRATIRLGLVKVKYPELIVHSGGKPIAKVRVKGIHVKKVSELTDHDALLDGFSSREELLQELKRTYGNIGEQDIVTVIELEVVKKFDETSEYPYMGLDPADLARIALRYLKEDLSEEEVNVLLDLTRTNSIRLTATRLFGGINKRYLVRKVLKKALRILKAKGVL